MKVWLTLTALLLGGAFSTATVAACDNPPLVLLPTAEKTSKKENKKDMEKEREQATEATQKYYTALQAYVACIQEELKSAGGDNAPAIYKTVLVARNNAAVAEWEAVQKWYYSVFGATPVGPPGPPASREGK